MVGQVEQTLEVKDVPGLVDRLHGLIAKPQVPKKKTKKAEKSLP